MELIQRARAGDGAAFRELTEPHRRELQDAEDAVQDTLLSAWQSLGGFEERASVRTWLYRIATNRCLNALRTAKRRPAKEWDINEIEPPEPTRLSEVVWLEPYPDALMPEASYEQQETISLAFMTALQLLAPRQRAVLILRDVLGYHADEVAEILCSTVDSVNSALKRARAGLQRGLPAAQAPPTPGSPAEQALVDRFVRAYQSGDVDALVALLTDDVTISMPPVPLEYQGRDVVARFYAAVMRPGRHYDLVPTRANRQLAFGSYHRGPGGIRHGAGLLVLTLDGDRISAMTRFDSSVLPWFGLPMSLPD